MSFIRSGSNPEQLYIVSDTAGVMIFHGLKPPYADADPSKQFVIPRKSFIRACKSWANFNGNVNTGGVRVFEEHIYTKTGKRVPPMRAGRPYRSDPNPTRFVVRLQYKKHWIRMWRVTWDYIMRDASAR